MHTPGPWRMIDRCGDNGKPYGISVWAKGKENQYGEPERIKICSLPDGATIEGGKAFPHQLSNAKLIAAAPDLFEALKGLFEHCSMIHKHSGDGDNTKQADIAIKNAQDAIKKATD